MPYYTFKCEKCSATREIQRTIDTRGLDGRCIELVVRAETSRCAVNTAGEIVEIPQTVYVVCGGTMKREGVELTARMSESWKP